MGPWMRQVVGFGDRSTGRVISGANMGCTTETSGGLSTIGNSHCAAASSQVGEFLELQSRWVCRVCRLSAQCGYVPSRPQQCGLLPHDCGHTYYSSCLLYNVVDMLANVLCNYCRQIL